MGGGAQQAQAGARSRERRELSVAPGRGWLLYGANGYTGELIAREALARGLRPVLAGRTAETVSRLAAELELPWRAFDLEDPIRLGAELQDVAVVLHAAGPFEIGRAHV